MSAISATIESAAELVGSCRKIERSDRAANNSVEDHDHITTCNDQTFDVIYCSRYLDWHTPTCTQVSIRAITENKALVKVCDRIDEAVIFIADLLIKCLKWHPGADEDWSEVMLQQAQLREWT